MREKIFGFFSIVGLVVLILMMNMTTPSMVGPLGVLVFFTTIYFLSFVIFRIILKVVYKIMTLNFWGTREELYATLLAFVPIMLLFMKAFSMTNIMGFLLVGIFEILAGFLVYKKF